MVDDFHGTGRRENFMNGMRHVLPVGRSRTCQSGDESPYSLRHRRQDAIPASICVDRQNL